MFQPNTLVNGRYLILNELARGGMGIIYLAIDQQFEDEVALKLSSLDERGKQAFENEAKLLSKLRHTGLPQVRGYFFEGNNQCLVMEFIEGENLHHRVKEIYDTHGRGFSLTEALPIIEQLCGIVAYLHSHTPPVIHRDIKPENIKQMSNGQIILLDFGMAKSQHTQLVGGTPAFASMEQLIGMPTSVQSDVYSIGATVYNLLSGIMPTPVTMRFKGLIDDKDDSLPSLSQLNLNLPLRVSEVISQAMRLSAEDRQTSAAEFWKGFEEACLAKDATAPSSSFQIPKPTFDSSIPTQVLGESNSALADTAPAFFSNSSTPTPAKTVSVTDSIQPKTVLPRFEVEIPQIKDEPIPETKIEPKPEKSKLPLIIGVCAVALVLLLGASGVFALWRLGYFSASQGVKEEPVSKNTAATPMPTLEKPPVAELKNNLEVSLYLKQAESAKKVSKDYIFRADNQAKYQGDLMYFGILPDKDGVLYVVWHDFVGNYLSLIYPTRRFPTSLETIKANKEMRFPPIQEIGFDKIQTAEHDYNADRIYFIFAPNHEAELIKEIKDNLPEENEISLNEAKAKAILEKLGKIVEQNPVQKETISDNTPVKFANAGEIIVGFVELKSAKKS
jgi:serine/threonine protein kinase